MKRGLKIWSAGLLLAATVGSILTTGSTAFAAYQEVNVTINGAFQNFDQPAVSINGATLVPMRAIFERLGADIQWNQSTSTVTATKGSTVIKLSLGNTIAYVNGNAVTLSVKARSINGSTMVPLRFISEALGGNAEWDKSSRTAEITSAENLALPSSRDINQSTSLDSDYFDEDSYSDPEKYTKAQRELNEMFGMDVTKALTPSFEDYAQMAEETLKAENEDRRLKSEASVLTELLGKGDRTKIKTKWESYDTSTMIGVFKKLGYDNQALLWDNMTLLEHAGLWKYVDNQGRFFDQLDDEDKKDIWFLATDDLEKIMLFVYLGSSGSEGSQVHLWEILPPVAQIQLYDLLDERNRTMLTDQLSPEENSELQKLLKNPPKPELDENGAAG